MLYLILDIIGRYSCILLLLLVFVGKQQMGHFHSAQQQQIYYHFPILLFSVSITFFCWVRINSLFAKFFLSSFNSIYITRYSSSCSLYFLASRLQWATSFYKLPIFFRSLARPNYSLCRHYSFYENLSKERSCLSLEAYLERLRELLEWFDFIERLELARFSWGFCGCWAMVFSCDFLEVTESLMDFFYCEAGLGLFFSLEYFGLRTDYAYVLILRQGTVGVVLSWGGATLVLTVLLPACYCFLRYMARCMTSKSQSLFSSSSYQSSQRDGQEQRNLFVDFYFSLLPQRRKRAVSSLAWCGGSFCYRKARLLRCLPSFSFSFSYSSQSDSSETLSIFLSNSISLRYNSPISLFFVRISLSRTR